MNKMYVLAVFVIIGVIVLFSACENTKKEMNDDTMRFESGCYFNKNWNETVGTYSKSVVSNKETALEIAKAIFEGMEKSIEAEGYMPQSVFYDEQDEVWIVSFWEKTDSITLGGDCNIAIQKADGKILRIWFGE